MSHNLKTIDINETVNSYIFFNSPWVYIMDYKLLSFFISEHFEVDYKSFSDYYPYGMLMDGRSYTNSDYRWGFNGMEKITELNVKGNSLDFGARIYDSRIGRWMSVDPESFKGPFFSPYISMNNSPIFNMDPDGNWVIVSTTKFYKSGENLKVKKWYNIFKKTVQIRKEITVGDVRFFDSNSVPLNDDQKGLMIENYKAQLTASFQNKILTKKGKPPIMLDFCFHDQPVFIPKLENLKGNEEVIILGPLLTDKYGALGISINNNRSLMGVSNIWGNVSNAVGTFSHEFAHQRSKNGLKNALFEMFVAPLMKYRPEAGYFDHEQYGVYSQTNDKSTNYENAESIKKGSKGIKIRKLKRELRKNV